MNNMFSKSAIWVVVALLLFMLFKQFDTHIVAGGSKTIAYSELLDEIKQRRSCDKDVVIIEAGHWVIDKEVARLLVCPALHLEQG